MPLVVKINVRHTVTGSPIRTLRLFNNFSFNLKHNSLASTFSFDFLFDPRNQEHAEIICVSHLHECLLYYTTNTDPNYRVNDNDRFLTGYLLCTGFKDTEKPEMVKVSGYSKPGILTDCDIPPDQYPLEIDGMTFKEIITKVIKPFNLGLVIDRRASGVNIAYTEKDPAEKADEDDIGKTAPESSQNVASYLTDLAKQRNIVLSHNTKGNVWITTPNTKGTPILDFDFTDGTSTGNYKKIPGVECEMTFNGQPLHTHITVKQQADDEEDSNGAEITIRNPLIPVNTVYRPKTHIISSGDEFTVGEAANYEMSREIREGINLKISLGIIDIKGKLITPNNTITIRNPNLFLYNKSRWFIQSTYITADTKKETCVMDCVLPFAYDFDRKGLKNVFVDPHQNLPRF
jgi:prophage tail gpP-like protein